MHYNQAPKLFIKGTQHSPKSNGFFYQQSQEIMDIVNRLLNGKQGNQLKLIYVLLGTSGKGDFRVSEKWICDRTGMTQDAYNKARKALIDRGWIVLVPSISMTLDIDAIRREGIASNRDSPSKTREDIASDNVVQKPSATKAQDKGSEGIASDFRGTVSNNVKTIHQTMPQAFGETLYNIKEYKENRKEIKNTRSTKDIKRESKEDRIQLAATYKKNMIDKYDEYPRVIREEIDQFNKGLSKKMDEGMTDEDAAEPIIYFFQTIIEKFILGGINYEQEN